MDWAGLLGFGQMIAACVIAVFTCKLAAATNNYTKTAREQSEAIRTQVQTMINPVFAMTIATHTLLDTGVAFPILRIHNVGQGAALDVCLKIALTRCDKDWAWPPLHLPLMTAGGYYDLLLDTAEGDGINYGKIAEGEFGGEFRLNVSYLTITGNKAAACALFDYDQFFQALGCGLPSELANLWSMPRKQAPFIRHQHFDDRLARVPVAVSRFPRNM